MMTLSQNVRSGFMVVTLATLRSRSGGQLRHVGRLSQIITEDRDVDVFGEPGDQTESLGKRSTPFEQHARAADC